MVTDIYNIYTLLVLIVGVLHGIGQTCL